ncbi:MAG: response regulator [Anaerolineales bacterium]|nr:response regulator [Anaerolineales bacterium]
MTSKEIIDTLLKLIETLTAWPIILLLIVFLFRKQISAFLPELGHRLQKAEIGGSKFEFSEIQKAAVNALPEVIEKGIEEYKDEPERLAGYVREQVKKFPEFQATTPTITPPSIRGCSILWVDDKPMNNVYESSVLKRLGASILFVRSTDEALTFLNRDNFDLIISDALRDENGRSNPNAGYELLEKLGRTNRKIPLIFYTSSTTHLNPNRTQSAYGIADTPSTIIDLTIRALKLSK